MRGLRRTQVGSLSGEVKSDHKRNESVGLTIRALVCSPCQVSESLFRLQSKLTCQLVDCLDLGELRIVEGVAMQGGIGEPSALDRGFEAVTIAFHWERPVAPDRSTSPDAVSYMKECMNGDWACRHTTCVVLIVKPVGSKVKSATIQILRSVPFIFFDPVNKSIPKKIDFFVFYLEFEAGCQQFDKENEVFVILHIIEPSPQQNRANIKCPKGPHIGCAQTVIFLDIRDATSIRRWDR